VTIWTSDISKAGTDSNVFLQIYGVDGKTEKNQLRNRSDNFERAQKDVFKVRFIIISYDFFPQRDSNLHYWYIAAPICLVSPKYTNYIYRDFFIVNTVLLNLCSTNCQNFYKFTNLFL